MSAQNKRMYAVVLLALGVTVCATVMYWRDTYSYRFGRAQRHLWKREFTSAVLQSSKAIEIDPTRTGAYIIRGRAYLALEEFDKAISNLTKAIELDPAYATNYINRGRAFRMTGQHDLAISDLSKAIELAPRGGAYVERGNAYREKGQYYWAIADYSRMLELYPKRRDAYYNRAVAYYHLEEYDKAWEDVHQATGSLGKFPRGFLENLRKASGRE
jgi:tetratricopeptide (TPR) repeat protein